ncbi:hypothetical protein R1flu_022028 [Riccia fluitans]|uniref:Gamma-tubulin complex component n=1 Tax=Riccia fluitans TaxID=41844 RepID=A0ABD1ZSG7_9MARC
MLQSREEELCRLQGRKGLTTAKRVKGLAAVEELDSQIFLISTRQLQFKRNWSIEVEEKQVVVGNMARVFTNPEEEEKPKGYPSRVQDLLEELVLVCKSSSEAAALFHDHLMTESGEFMLSLKKSSSQTVPKPMEVMKEQQVLLKASRYPDKLKEKIIMLKDAGVQGIDRYIWLVGQIIADPDVKKLVSVQPGAEASLDSGDATLEAGPSLTSETTEAPGGPSADISKLKLPSFNETTEASVSHSHEPVLDESKQSGHVRRTPRIDKMIGVPKPLIEGVSYPGTPQWNIDRPFLTGKHLFQQEIVVPTPYMNISRRASLDRELLSNGENVRSLGAHSPAVQELLVIDDLLYMMVGIEGNYIRVRRGRLKENSPSLYVDPTMDSSIQELSKRLLPLCENYLVVSQFAESRSHFRHGLVNHALAAALRAILQDYNAMIAQLEYQFRLTRLSLQGLWFFCQPMMGAMSALSAVVQKANVKNLSGAAILNLLQSQATAMAGDTSARSLLQNLTQAASAPYFGILERWISEGVIDDPYGEFLIDENKALQKESLSQDYHATYWHQRYSLRQDVPGFLSGLAENILTAGKYLNAVRECGHSIKIQFPEDVQSADAGSSRLYMERINVAYSHASGELLNLILNKFDLMGRLRSVKHYFFMDQGDFLVHFMDIAKDELMKRSSSIVMEKLQSLLELALRTSVSASDPYHDDLTCNVEKSALLTQLQSTITTGLGSTETNGNPESFLANLSLNGSGIGTQGATGNITGIETFTLDYKVPWPLSLVVSRKALTKYQLIFRHLFHVKHVERQLCITWQAHQATRRLSFVGTAISRSYVLCQKMLHFMHCIEHYLTFEVLEPNWHSMEASMQNAKSIDEVMQQHDRFLDKCLKECMLLWPQILKKLEALKATCQQYATTTQWLIPSVNIQENQSLSNYHSQSNRDDVRGTARTRLRFKQQSLRSWKPEDERTFKSTLGRVDDEFKAELKELIFLLISHSQTEPCFAHLAQTLQGEYTAI